MRPLFRRQLKLPKFWSDREIAGYCAIGYPPNTSLQCQDFHHVWDFVRWNLLFSGIFSSQLIFCCLVFMPATVLLFVFDISVSITPMVYFLSFQNLNYLALSPSKISSFLSVLVRIIHSEFSPFNASYHGSAIISKGCPQLQRPSFFLCFPALLRSTSFLQMHWWGISPT